MQIATGLDLHSYSMETQYCVSYIGARLLNGTHGVVDAVYELIDMFKVSRHFCRQHHVYNGLPKGSKLIPDVERLREFSTGSVRVIWNMINVWYLSMFLKMLHLLSRTVSWKARAAWWTLQDGRLSLYRMASFTACIAQEWVGAARVINVMDRCCQQRCYFIQLVKTALQAQHRYSRYVSEVTQNCLGQLNISDWLFYERNSISQ